MLRRCGRPGLARSATAMLVTALAVLGWLAPAAQAETPVRLSGQITDSIGALSPQRASVTRAIDRLYADQRVKLFVVYVRTFSGQSPAAWVHQSATVNGLGRRDILLGVAAQHRQYAVSADPHLGLSDTQLD